METKINGKRKEYNEALNKTSINKTNSKLLLFRSENKGKHKLHSKNIQNLENTKYSNKMYASLQNKQNLNDEFKLRITKEKIIKNKRKRPFSSGLYYKNNNSQFNPKIIKNNSSIELTRLDRSVNEKKINNSLNKPGYSSQQIQSGFNPNTFNSSTTFLNHNKSVKFSMNNKSTTNKLSHQNLRYVNNNINYDSNAYTNINNIYDAIYNNESQKEIQPPLPLEQIRSIQNLNIRSIKNKNPKNIFRYFPKSRSLNSSPHYRLLNNNSIFEENEKNNTNDLIKYKKVLYSSLSNLYNNPTLNKVRQYNKEIRIRNDVKNIKQRNRNEKDNIKRYSFYKYEEYMDKIEKEEINLYKTMQKKKREINIQQIFHSKFPIPKKSVIINNNNNNNKNNNNENNPLNKSKSLNKSKLSNRDILIQSNKSLLISKILTNRNKSSENGNNSNSSSTRRFVRIPIKKSNNKLIFNKESDEDSGSSEMPIIINNYEIKRSGIRKLRKTNTVMFQNIFLKKFREEQLLFDSEASNESSKDQLSAEVNKIRKKDLLNLSDDLDTNKKNQGIDKIKFDKIKSTPMKSQEKHLKDKEIFENLRKNYFQRREKMIRMNRKNLLAQKLLLEKIVEIDKNNNKNKKYRSKFSPFFNLNYKYEDEEMSKRKKKILDKYYKKNLNQNKFSVRLKNKSSMSFLTNNNNTINASQLHLISQANDLKSEYFSINDYFNNENTPRNPEDKDKYIIKMNQNENLINLKEIENIDNKINFDENEKEKKENEINRNKEKDKIKIDEIKLNKMIKEEKKKKFENEFFKKYENIIKAYEKKERLQKKLITNEMLEEAGNIFFNLLEENENIIKSSKKTGDAELFIEFREKMNSLAKYSKKELNLYIFRNYQVINNILEECKRDKQRENRINRFIKILREDLEEILNRREYILKFLKVLDYQPFPNYSLNES